MVRVRSHMDLAEGSRARRPGLGRQGCLAHAIGPGSRGLAVRKLRVAVSETSRYSKPSWVTLLVLVWFHVQAIAAFFVFSWSNLIVATVLYWLAGGLGITMGYHRLHTHRGFKTPKLFEYFLAVCG